MDIFFNKFHIEAKTLAILRKMCYTIINYNFIRKMVTVT